jgi:hypothetical protein
MESTVVIPRRFCGPRDSGHGGYSCGVTALALTDGPAEVVLRRPPPLDRPLRVERVDDSVALHDGDDVVSRARPASTTIETIAPASYDEAVRAAQAFDYDEYSAAHPFPSCFACGTGRAEGDGLGLCPAETERADDAIVWPWAPAEDLADDSGRVGAAIVWAALDCPSGLAWIRHKDDIGPSVLAKMVTVVHRLPAPGERLVVGGWPIAQDGRRLRSGSVIWSDDGDVLAACEALWIELTPDQHAAFGVVGG